MLETLQDTRQGQNASELLHLYHQVIAEWMYELDFYEQQIWLWNAKAELDRIKRRRRF